MSFRVEHLETFSSLGHSFESFLLPSFEVHTSQGSGTGGPDFVGGGLALADDFRSFLAMRPSLDRAGG
ncbi:hypothetical protein CDS [Bradyrhizobium sp.]|nr:hypothetical protein CDS [Bradyrhizobium sp.]